MRNVNLDTHFTALDVTITKDNVQYLGENIAICSMKHLLPYRNIYKLYNGMIWDMHSLDNYERLIADGYDIAQEAIVYLCQFIGKKLGDMTTNKYGKQITIKHGCASVVGNMIYKHYKNFKYTTHLCATDKAKTVEPFDETDTEAGYNKVERIIAGMNLTKKQKLTLDCYLKGMREGEVIKFLNVVHSSVWRSRRQLQKKYLMYIKI